MAHKTIITHEFMPAPERIVFGELASLMAMNENQARKADESFWLLPRGTPGAPLPTQDLHYYTYYGHAAAHPDVLQTHLHSGSIRSGKTDGVIALNTRLMLRHPGTRALIVRWTLEELFTSFVDSLIKWYRKRGITYHLRKGVAPELELANGSKWMIRSAAKADKAGENKADSLGGSEYALAVLEECNEIPEGFFDTVVGRMSQRTLPAPKIDMIENPPPEDHWTCTRFVQPADGKIPDHHFNYHYTIEDNRINLGDEYVDSVRDRYKDSPTLFKKFYLGLFTPTIKGKPIYRDRFRRDVHTSAGPLTWNPEVILWRFWDFGYRRPALVVAQDDPSSGQIRVLLAKLGKEEMINEFAARMKHHLNIRFPGGKYRDVCDIAGKKRSDTSPKSAVELLEETLGSNCAMQYTLIEYGVGVINEQLSSILPRGHKSRSGVCPALLICSAGANILADGFEFGYTQDPDAKKDEIKPVKDMYYEHVMDAFRYGMVQLRQPTTAKTPQRVERGLWRAITEGNAYIENEILKPRDQQRWAYYGFGKGG